MGLKAVGFRIVVIPDKVEEKKGKILIPETAQEQQQRAMDTGKIVSIGKDAWKNHGDGKPWAKVGDTIIFGKYNGVKYTDKVTKTDYVILNDDDMLAKPE